MAINVNTVYQTVLLILNKEQRGYMTPLEFNKIGAQVQLEIFEKYFEDLNQQLRVPQANVDYSDRIVNLDEKISIFKTNDSATYSNGSFQLPSLYSGTTSTTQTFNVSAPASTTYTLTGNSLALSNSGAIPAVFLNNIELSENAFTLSGATLTLSSTPSVGDNIILNLYPKQFYRLGNVVCTRGAIPSEEVERVGKSELYHLLSSNLTKPTKNYPVYTYSNNLLTIYPTTIVSGVLVDYIRKPIPPNWFFTGAAQYIFQPQQSNNFELHTAEQTELILKILLYAGVVIRSEEIIQVAASQVQQEEMNQKS